MNISSGISEINFNSFQSNRINSEKIFTWPTYNAGKIEKIHNVIEKTDSNIIYSKSSHEDKEKILNLSKNYSQIEYTSEGNISHKSPVIEPGSLFYAVV